MCERLKQAVLKLACLLPPVFGINHLESANAALFGLDTGVRHANMQRIMQRWIGPPAERSLAWGSNRSSVPLFFPRTGVYTPVRAKHGKDFVLLGAIDLGLGKMQRNFT